MKKFVRFIICALVLGIVAASGMAAPKQYERILSYDVQARMEADTSLVVREHITFMVTGKNIKRGIVRAFPVDYKTHSGRKVTVGFDVLSTAVDDVTMKWVQEKKGRGVMVRIGDPNKILKPGVHSFTIEYRTTKQLGFFEDHDELYWNVTGNEWAFPMEKVTFSLSLPGYEAGEGFSAVQWYVGRYGSTDSDRAELNPDGSVSTIGPLQLGEGLTVAYGWPKGIVMPPPLTSGEKVENWFRSIAEPLCTIILWGGMASALYWAWRSVKQASGNRVKRKTVIPLFRAPKGMTPALARYISRMEFDATSFSAELINLAVAGDIKIVNAKKRSFELQWQKKRHELDLEPMDRKLSEDLFDDDEPVGACWKLGSSSFQFFNARANLKFAVERLGSRLFTVYRLPLGIYISLFVSGLIVTIVELVFDGALPTDLSVSALTMTFLSLLGFFWTLGRAPKGRKKSIIGSIILYICLGLIVWFLAWIIMLPWNHMPLYYLLCMVLLPGGVLLSPHSYTLSDEGHQARAAVEGLKMYINTAEKSRLEAFNAPDDTPEVFERLLPYAVALDCAKTWALRFEALLGEGRYSPDWYEGRPLWRQRSYGDAAAAAAFSDVSSINDFASGFSSSLSTTSVAPGSSSGFSGDSSSYDGGGGSSGGGSSGGGGGGGGGHGW